MGCVSLYIKRDTYTPTTPTQHTRIRIRTYTHVGHVPSHIWDAYRKKYPQNLFMSKVFRIFIVYLIRHHERRTKTESI